MAGNNRQFASQLKYNISINRLPNVDFYVQSVNIPSLTTGRAPTGTPFSKLFHQGDHPDWGMLDLQFKVDENFNNWYEIHKWLVGITFPRNWKEKEDLKKDQDKDLDGKSIVPANRSEVQRKVGNIYSQITLNVLSSHNNPIIEFQFVDAWPTGMSEVILDTTDDDVEFLTARVSFSYTYYKVLRP